MHSRLLIVFFLSISSGLSNANSGVWDCEKVKGQEEWSCSSVEKSVVKAKTIAPIVEREIVKQLALPNPIIPIRSKSKPRPVAIKPLGTVDKQQGWTCASNETKETWNCRLIGADPKGKTQVVGDPDVAQGIFATAFDLNQQQVFETLHSQLKYNPWQSCTSSASRALYIPRKNLRNTAPMNVTADYSEVFDKEMTHFFGNVEIIRADQSMLSDVASYNTVSETMDAQGHVYYSEDELSLYSDTALLNLASDEARLRKALFISPSAPIRGSADVVYRDSKLLSRYTSVAFTSCRPGNQDWIAHANKLKMNKQTGKASVKHAWLEFKGIPFLYTPYLSFPLDDRRISGLLPPSFSNNENNGFNFVIPYYWNMAPNYDLTLWPRYMTKRGEMLGGKFRYLTKINTGSLSLEYLPYDLIRKKSRYSGVFKDKAQLSSHINSAVDLNFVSDADYFDELNNALGIATSRFLKSQVDLHYNRNGIDFRAHLQTHQTIDKDIADASKPYQELPQVTLNLNHSFNKWPVDLAMENEYVNFYRQGRVAGQRFNIKPSISIPIASSAGYITPKASLQYTQYFLEDQMAGQAADISRVLPIFSVDGGLTFERNLNFARSTFLHTLEPRLFYLYIPKDNQEDIPLFDTALNDFNFSSLFRENRFSGADRVQDANQITLALTSRLIDSTSGQERLNFSIGEIFYAKDREVMLKSTDADDTHNFSNVVAELNGQLSNHFSFSSGLQWNPDVNDITRGQLELHYRHRPEKIINLGYRYRRDNPYKPASIIQTNASIHWSIYDNWFGVGRWQYSLKHKLTTESFLGLEKESCCWRFRIIWRRYAKTSSNSNNKTNQGETDQGIFVQLELKGLANFGDKVDQFLEKNLKGYVRAQ